MIYALYANAFQLIPLCMFKSGGTEKKNPDVVETPDTKNLCLAMFQVTTKFSCYMMFFLGLDLVLSLD